MTKKEKDRSNRPSPPISAAENPGATEFGNDGLQYVSTANKNGVFAWKKVK